MKVGFMGRTKILADTIKLVVDCGNHEARFIWTSKAEPYYKCPEAVFEQLASDIGCEYIYSPSVKEVEESSTFDDVDVVISFNFVNIIPKSFLQRFPHGVLNAHAGDLPKYKGNACPNWAILNEEESVTLTVHEMSEKLDSGPIYTQAKFYLNQNSYITDVYDWLGVNVPEFFLESLNLIESGFIPREQRVERSLRTFPRKPEDSKIEFNSGVDNIYRLIRALSHPFSGAFCFLNDEDKKLFVYKAEPVTLPYDFYAVNGQILEIDSQKQSFVISSSNEALEILSYEFEGLSQAESYDLISSSMRNRLK